LVGISLVMQDWSVVLREMEPFVLCESREPPRTSDVWQSNPMTSLGRLLCMISLTSLNHVFLVDSANHIVVADREKEEGLIDGASLPLLSNHCTISSK
jgi:hypothetical protein